MWHHDCLHGTSQVRSQTETLMINRHYDHHKSLLTTNRHGHKLMDPWRYIFAFVRNHHHAMGAKTSVDYVVARATVHMSQKHTHGPLHFKFDAVCVALFACGTQLITRTDVNGIGTGWFLSSAYSATFHWDFLPLRPVANLGQVAVSSQTSVAHGTTRHFPGKAE